MRMRACFKLKSQIPDCSLFYNVYLDMIFYPVYCNSFRYQNLSQPQHVLLLWWSGTVATMLRPLKSEFRKYISLRINIASSIGTLTYRTDISFIFKPDFNTQCRTCLTLGAYRNLLLFRCENIFVRTKKTYENILREYNFTTNIFLCWLVPCYTQGLPQLLLR